MAAASLWVGLGVTMATHGANPHGKSIPVGGAWGYNGNAWSQSHGNSIPVGGAKGHHSNKMGRADFYGNSTHVGGAWGLP